MQFGELSLLNVQLGSGPAGIGSRRLLLSDSHVVLSSPCSALWVSQRRDHARLYPGATLSPKIFGGPGQEITAALGHY